MMRPDHPSPSVRGSIATLTAHLLLLEGPQGATGVRAHGLPGTGEAAVKFNRDKAAADGQCQPYWMLSVLSLLYVFYLLIFGICHLTFDNLLDLIFSSITYSCFSCQIIAIVSFKTSNKFSRSDLL